MKDKIEVGEYVKNQNGIIRKIVEIYNGKLYVDKLYYDKENEYFYEQYEFMIDDEITKHSKDIIDLIEVGDYVNGERVINIIDGFAEGTMEIELSSHRKIYRHHIEDIKSIVTKEMMKSVEYRVV